MAIVDKTLLKGYFNTGDIPTELQFANLIDSLEAVGVAQTLIDALKNGSSETIASLKTLLDTLQSLLSTQSGLVSGHTTTIGTHNTQIAQLLALLGSDDLTLDTIQEIVAYIKANKVLIDSITTDKLNASVYNTFLTQHTADLALKANQSYVDTALAIKADKDSSQTLTYAASIALNFANGKIEKVALTGNITFTTSGLAADLSKTVILTADATNRTLTFPAGWVFLGEKPTTLAANKKAWLTLFSESTTDAGVTASYAAQI